MSENKLDKAAEELNKAAEEAIMEQVDRAIDMKITRIIEIDKIPDNSILIVSVPGKPSQELMMAMKKTHDKYAKTFEEKNVSFFVCPTGMDLENIPEEQMEEAGWIKKNKPMILTPDKF
jgi:hypothetical protein